MDERRRSIYVRSIACDVCSLRMYTDIVASDSMFLTESRTTIKILCVLRCLYIGAVLCSLLANWASEVFVWLGEFCYTYNNAVWY